VTLFANILQNPGDARARSDIKLMNVVVNFLSTLVSDESNGSIKRMLGLCGEFERIAKVVLDKAERESHARKKRKTAPDESDQSQREPNEAQTATSPRPKTQQAPSTSGPFSPSMFANNPATSTHHAKQFGNDPSIPSNTGLPNDLPSNIHTMPGLGQEFPDMLSPEQFGNVPFSDPGSYDASPNIGSFQQPFVPQDLWQMPMTIEWDWADMSTNFPIFESGGVGSNGQPQ
jgi:hypothetical protein